jgi:hypothetical protein
VDSADPPSASDLQAELDPDTLLAGEDPGTSRVRDAVHWAGVYRELLSVKSALLERADQVMRGVSDDAMKEAAVDRGLLRVEADRCRRRLDYWTGRARELADAGGTKAP